MCFKLKYFFDKDFIVESGFFCEYMIEYLLVLELLIKNVLFQSVSCTYGTKEYEMPSDNVSA
jgi:hypothetical protein